MRHKMIEVSEDISDRNSNDDDDELPMCFCKRRHLEKIEGKDLISQTWRMKDRMKTVSVALVLCLKVGLDPPDVIKIQPCAQLECWIDPSSVSPQKASELISANLQKQYELWQPRARYKQIIDPTVEDVKKLCTSLRRNAKEERVLFHYNGHGVPRPTANGEIWVFNRNYTQYIPLSIYDLQTWMGAPSIYVYDCSNAGIIVEWFNKFAEQHERELEQIQANAKNTQTNAPNVVGVTSAATTAATAPPQPQPPPLVAIPTFKNCIQLAACSANQLLPMNPLLPADLFTSCLTTPLKTALKWYTLQRTSDLVPQVSYELIERIPGQLNDRRTMLGELNWIFAAITDTIAWNSLPRELFQKLFRQDLLVTSLLRNFLLAERILRSYDCTPISSPSLPHCYRHAMWAAWDLSLDLALSQLPSILLRGEPFRNLPFFEEQLTAFQVWLERGNEERTPPEQLPIVLQVLLSQVHRLRALGLLARFVDMGPWAVNLALSVGIFPYVLKLLQSSTKEIRPLLVFIWAKILAVDYTCQVDLVRDQGHKYFLSVLQDYSISADYRTLSAFVLACIVHNFPMGKASALQGSLVSMCLVQIYDTNWVLRQWLTLCLGQLWQNYDKARWSGVRDLAHEKLYPLLLDPVPEVRAAAVFALGTFIGSVTQRSEHANTIDRSIAMTLWNTVSNDMSPLVRMELVAAIQWMVILFESQFVQIYVQDNKMGSLHGIRNPGTFSLERYRNTKRGSSPSSIAQIGTTALITSLTGTLGVGSIYTKLWLGLVFLTRDPFPGVSKMAIKLVEHISNQAYGYISIGREAMNEKCMSLPPSPNTQTSYLSGDSPPKHKNANEINGIQLTRMNQSFTGPSSTATSTIGGSPGSGGVKASTQKMTESTGDELSSNVSTNSTLDNGPQSLKPLVSTCYFDWALSQFSKPSTSRDEIVYDRDSVEHLERVEKTKRNAKMKLDAREQYRRVIFGRLDSQIWCGRSQSTPALVKLHPYEDQIAVAYSDRLLVRDWTRNRMTLYAPSQIHMKSVYGMSSYSRVTAVEFINAHLDGLVLVGYDDGYVRLWRPPKASEEPRLISAWFAMVDAMGVVKTVAPNKITRCAGNFVSAWHQQSQTLMVGGDSRVICLWDVERELKCGELQVDSESSVRVLSLAPNGLLAAGCGDGSVRIFDRRLKHQNCIVQTYHDHSDRLLTVCLRNDCENLVTGCENGTVRSFDIRKSLSVSTSSWSVGPDVTAMAVHPAADVMVCGTQGLTVYGLDGQQLSQIKSHEGFMGSRIGHVSCLSFHNYKVSLAAGFFDNNVSVFTLDPKKH